MKDRTVNVIEVIEMIDKNMETMNQTVGIGALGYERNEK